jgi:hypothetical protein
MILSGLIKPVLNGMSSSTRQRKTYRTAEYVTAKLAFTLPWTCLDEELKSIRASFPWIVIFTSIFTGLSVMPSSSRKSENAYVPSGIPLMVSLSILSV